MPGWTHCLYLYQRVKHTAVKASFSDAVLSLSYRKNRKNATGLTNLI